MGTISSVCASDAELELLQQLATRYGRTKSQVMKDSMTFLAQLVEQTERGSTILIHNPHTDQSTAVLVPFYAGRRTTQEG